MPIGPPPGPKFSHPSMGMGMANFHHMGQQQMAGAEEGPEPEVKKIYLLQPMPKVQPQPQLKGGGFMGPVQTHIHLPGSQHSGHKFRVRPASGTKTPGGYGSDSAAGDVGHLDQHEHPKQPAKGGDVKILPIVVIPPMAPMPPVQLSASTGGHYQQPRMTLTPQFNNYIVSSGERKRISSSHHPSSGGGRSRHADQSSFSDYGGSVGGSVFRENYAARSRGLRGRANHRHSSQQFEGQASRPSKSRDYDYGDSDYDSSSRSLNSDYQYPTRTNQRRNYQRSSSQVMRQRDGYSAARVNSIRDIVDQQLASHFEDEPPPPSSSSVSLSPDSLGDTNDELSGRPTRHQSLDLSFNESPLESPRESRLATRSQAANEISLIDDIEREIASQLGQRHQARQSQDLNSLYYDREPSQQQPTIAEQRRHIPTLDSSSSSSSRPRQRGAGGASSRLAYPDERDLFDDDEWRFESIKSVSHVATDNNHTMTNNSTTTTTSIPTTTTLTTNNSSTIS